MSEALDMRMRRPQPSEAALCAVALLWGCASSPSQPEPASAESRQAYARKRNEALRAAARPASFAELLNAAAERRVVKVEARWVGELAWNRHEDGLIGESEEDALIRVEPLFGGEPVRLALHQAEFEAHTEVLKSLSGRVVSLTVLRTPELDPKDCAGRILDLESFEGELGVAGWSGIRTTYDFQGTATERCRFEAGALEGPYTAWWGSGAKRTEGRFVRGLRVGEWRSYYGSGALSQRGEYLEGSRHGTWTWWFDDSQVERRLGYERGQRVGVWERFWTNGQLRESGRYLADAPEGTWTYFDADGQKMREEHFVGGAKDGLFQRWDSDGELIEAELWRRGELVESR